MKLFLIIFFFVFCECDATTLFESISNKFAEYGKFIVNLFKPIELKIKRTFFPDHNKSHNKAINKRLQSSTIAVGARELAIQHGKKMETHIVHTRDEYFITLHRLTPLKGTESNNIVLFHHGLLGSSADWLLLGPEKSLPYLLLNEGYDVWLMNARGNYYSYPIALEKDESYWNFTWQEMGIYDLPVVIDYIMKVTNTKENLTYIGHSMGTTVFVTMLSFFPKYNANFKIAILLAPLVFMSKTKGPLYSIKSEAFHPTRNLLSITGIGEFVPRRKLPLWLAERYCDVSAIYCTNPLLFLTGVASGIGDWNKTYVTYILHNVPAGGSTNTILHYAQMIKSRKFHQFQNKRKEISLKNVTVPILLMSSTDDIMSNTFDVAKLYRKLPCPIDHYMLNGVNVTHMDFVWSPNADVLIYAKILKYLHQGTECQGMAYHKLRSNNHRA